MPPTLMVAGLLANTAIAGGVPAGGLVAAGVQPGMRIRSSSSDKERMMIFFNVHASKNILPATSQSPIAIMTILPVETCISHRISGQKVK